MPVLADWRISPAARSVLYWTMFVLLFVPGNDFSFSAAGGGLSQSVWYLGLLGDPWLQLTWTGVGPYEAVEWVDRRWSLQPGWVYLPALFVFWACGDGRGGPPSGAAPPPARREAEACA